MPNTFPRHWRLFATITNILLNLSIVLSLTSPLLFLPPIPEAEAQTTQLAFPTAEGFGRFSKGGRGGYVCHVNTLAQNSTGSKISGTPHHQGSFRYCTNLTGERTIVFDRGGTIDLSSGSRIEITNPNVTVAGQTAPGNQGIQIIGEDFNVWANHAILRYLRIRPGSDVKGPSSTGALDLGLANNIIADHMSLSWATDENAEVSNGQDITIQWSILSEGVGCPPDSNCNSSGYGLLATGSETNRVTLHHNLFAHNKDRSPRITGGQKTQLVNNVAYNVQAVATSIGANSTPLEVNIVGNYYKRYSDAPCKLFGGANVNNIYTTDSSVYLKGNVSPGDPNYRPDNTYPEDAICDHRQGPPYITIVNTPFNYPALPSETDAFTAYNQVRNQAGATIPARDDVDTRIVNDVTNGTGNYITDPSQVGGFLTFTTVDRPPGYDSDYDGIPNQWELDCSSALGGLSPTNSSDGAQIVSSTGYSKLEHFLNELAGDYAAGSCGGLGGGTTTFTPGPCSLYPAGSANFSPYGLHWDWTSQQKELLLKATCQTDSTTLDIGNGREVGSGANAAGLTYVYHQGYWNTGSGAWTPYSLQCSGTDKTKIVNAWCKGSAQASLPATAKWFVAYSCIWTGTKWQCGCSDSTCATTYWQVQGINR